VAAEDAAAPADSASETPEIEQLTTTRLAHYRETLCAVSPLMLNEAGLLRPRLRRNPRETEIATSRWKSRLNGFSTGPKRLVFRLRHRPRPDSQDPHRKILVLRTIWSRDFKISAWCEQVATARLARYRETVCAVARFLYTPILCPLLRTTRLAHYRETLCAVKPLQASNTAALILTRQQHIELLNVCARCRHAQAM